MKKIRIIGWLILIFNTLASHYVSAQRLTVGDPPPRITSTDSDDDTGIKGIIIYTTQPCLPIGGCETFLLNCDPYLVEITYPDGTTAPCDIFCHLGQTYVTICIPADMTPGSATFRMCCGPCEQTGVTHDSYQDSDCPCSRLSSSVPHRSTIDINGNPIPQTGTPEQTGTSSEDRAEAPGPLKPAMPGPQTFVFCVAERCVNRVCTTWVANPFSIGIGISNNSLFSTLQFKGEVPTRPIATLDWGHHIRNGLYWHNALGWERYETTVADTARVKVNSLLITPFELRKQYSYHALGAGLTGRLNLYKNEQTGPIPLPDNPIQRLVPGFFIRGEAGYGFFRLGYKATWEFATNSDPALLHTIYLRAFLSRKNRKR